MGTVPTEPLRAGGGLPYRARRPAPETESPQAAHTAAVLLRGAPRGRADASSPRAPPPGVVPRLPPAGAPRWPLRTPNAPRTARRAPRAARGASSEAPPAALLSTPHRGLPAGDLP